MKVLGIVAIVVAVVVLGICCWSCVRFTDDDYLEKLENDKQNTEKRD